MYNVHTTAALTTELARASRWFLDGESIDANIVVNIVKRGSKSQNCMGYTIAHSRTLTRTGKAGPKGTIFQQDRWELKDGTPTIEVAIIAEHLNRPPMDIYETTFHETVHAYASIRGIADCSLSGYHNAKGFKASAERLGLEVRTTIDGKPLAKTGGFKDTFIPPELEARMYETFVPNLDVFGLHRVEFERAKVQGPPKFECPACHEKVVGHSETESRDETNVLCGFDMIRMERVPAN